MFSGLHLVALVLACAIVLPHTRARNITNQKGVEIVKRHLRWNANKDIVSSTSVRNNLKINYLQPHSRSVGVSDTSAVYMAFTLYKRNGAWIVPNTGVFHFTDLKTATSLSSKCSPSTNHAGAYYHFYGTCPSADVGIVASGWCYRGSMGLVYNSYTFNSAGATYMDGQYYLNTNRAVNPIEITLLSNCYNSWKNSGFPVNSWKCPTSNIPVAAGLTGGSWGWGRVKRSTDECNNCDCLTSKGSVSDRRFVRDCLLFVFVIYNLLSTQYM